MRQRFIKLTKVKNLHQNYVSKFYKNNSSFLPKLFRYVAIIDLISDAIQNISESNYHKIKFLVY